MKVPFTSTQSHQSSNSNLKPVSRGNSTAARSTNACYEPKSVLDLRRSPSPVVADKTGPKSETWVSDEASLCVQWDENTTLDNFDDWDSLMRELGLHDDYSSPAALVSIPIPNPPPPPPPYHHQFSHSDPRTQFPLLQQLPDSQSFPTDFTLPDFSANHILNPNSNSFDPRSDFHPMNNWNNVGSNSNFVDELIRAADCFESNELQLAQAILARLNQQLPSPEGKPLHRAAFYFKESLQSLLTEPTRPSSSSSSEVVQAIKAYKNFSNVSPIVMFSNFTANQAILEAVDGTMFIHVVDFDIGFGGQWASFMKEVADRAESRKATTPVVRITAVVPEEYTVESRLIRDNLNQFARDLKIGFEIEFVLVGTFAFLSFKAIKFMEGEKIAVLLSPSIIQRMGTGFLNDLRQISPHVVVLIDGEGLTDGGTSSFRRVVIDGLELYSAILETLETAAANDGGSNEWIQKIEMFVLRPKIIAAVEAGRRQGSPPWRVAFGAAGLRAVRLSQFADFQAECLLRKVHVRGFQVAKRQAEMVLCWQGRPLVATSAWRC